MNRNIPTLVEFSAILTLAKHRSYRTASQELGMSTSALSRLIAGLEERIGTRLFDRDTRKVMTTVSGATFCRMAERMVNTADEVMAELDAHLSARHGHLTIAGLPSVTAGLLPGLLSSFSKAYPEINLRIIDALSGSVVEAIEAGRADIGFTAGTISTRSQLSFQPLMDDEFVAIGAPGGALDADRSYDWSELVDMSFIAMAEGTSVRELIDGACLRLGRTLSPRFEVAHLATAGALVAEGLGITAMPTLTLPVLPMERLIRRPVVNFGARRRIGLVRPSGRSLSPAAQAFLSHVSKSLPSLRAGLHLHTG